jgi:hypothetical protein
MKSTMTRELDVREADVLVAGGGPAGAAAAIAAARDGANVLLIEQLGFLGGMATAGLVPCWAPFTDHQKPVIGGLAMSTMREMKAQLPHLPEDRIDWVAIDAEVLKRILEDRVIQAGGRIAYSTTLADAASNQGRLIEAIVCDKAGLSAVRAKVFIDATGDADLVARAGGAFEKGDPDSGELQPATHCFVMAGVDAARYFAWQEERPNRQNVRDAVARAKAAGDMDIPEGHITAVGYLSPVSLGFNFSHIFEVDGTDAQRLSDAQVEGRRLVEQLARFIRKYCAGCENGVLVASGATIGIRETRRIVGEYRLTADDYFARRSFDDEILRNAYYLDVHWSRKQQERYAAGKFDWKDTMRPYGPGESHGVPYRCLIPKAFANVLVAGRCLSADRQAQGAVRCIPHCMAMGEAAGCAAAMAVAAGLSNVRDVDARLLRDKLRGYGAWLPAA